MEIQSAGKCKKSNIHRETENRSHGTDEYTVLVNQTTPTRSFIGVLLAFSKKPRFHEE